MHANPVNRTEAREALVRFYKRHNPAKLSTVDALLSTFQGREAAMMAALREKYGVPEEEEEEDVLHTVPAAGTSNNVREEAQQRAEYNRQLARLRTLLADMGSVDLAALAAHLTDEKDSGADADARERQRLLLLKHTVAYVEYLAQCAQEFLTIAHGAFTPAPSVDISFTAAAETSPQRPPPPPLPLPPPLPAAPPTQERTPPRSPSVAGTPPPPPSQRPFRVGRLSSPARDASRTATLAEPPWTPPKSPSSTPPDRAMEGPRRSVRGLGPGDAPKPVAVAEDRIISLSPPAPGSSSGVISTAAAAVAGSSGNNGSTCLSLRPGLYYESIVLQDCGALELTTDLPGAPVVLRPSSTLEPVLVVRGSAASVTVRGVVFVVGDASEAAARAPALPLVGTAPWQPASVSEAQRCPLVQVEDGASLRMEGCHVYNGAAGGVVAAGAGTEVRLHMCLLSLCGFAAAYAHSGATLSLSQCRVKNSEGGVRAAAGNMVGAPTRINISETTVEGHTGDGVIVDGAGCVCAAERCAISNNAGSGVYVGTGCEVRLVASSVELNAAYGVHRCQGSRLHLQQCFVRDNGLLPINEERA